MTNYSELPIYKATYDLLLRIYNQSQHWRRDLRYTLGEQLKKDITELLLIIYQANKTKDKLLYIDKGKILLVKIRLQIRIVSDLHAIGTKQYSLFAEMTENISKQLSGWEKYSKSIVEQKI